MRNRFARVTAIVVAAIFAASNYMSAAAAGLGIGQGPIRYELATEAPSEDVPQLPLEDKRDQIKEELDKVIEEADAKIAESDYKTGADKKLSDIVNALNKNEGYDFAGFTVDKQTILDAITVAKTAVENKLSSEGIDADEKETLSKKLEDLGGAEASINELESDKIALTDEIGTLADSESLLTSVLSKLAGNDVDEINATTFWEMIARQIIFEKDDKQVSIYFKDGNFYTDENASTQVENLTGFDDYLKEKGIRTALVEDDEHFGGYVIEDSKNPDEQIRMSDHEGNFLITDPVNITTGSVARAIESNVISLQDGDSESKLFSDGETIYSDVERTEAVENVTDVNGIKLDEADNHLSAYYLVGEDGEFTRDEEGHKVKFIDVDGNVSADADLAEDVKARAARFNDIRLLSGAENDVEKTVFLSDGEFYTDTELETSFNGTATEEEDYSELVKDTEKGHFGGLFLAADNGEYVTVGSGEDVNKVAVLNADGSVRAYEDIASDVQIDRDATARALYYRQTDRLISEDCETTDFSLLDEDYDELSDKEKKEYDELKAMRDSETCDFAVYLDDERVFEDVNLDRQLDELDVPIPEKEEDIKEWYAYDGDDLVLRLEPVVGLRFADIDEEDEDYEDEDEGFDFETYFVAYIAYNIDDEPIFVIHSDGSVDYDSTEVEVEDPELPELDADTEVGTTGDFGNVNIVIKEEEPQAGDNTEPSNDDNEDQKDETNPEGDENKDRSEENTDDGNKDEGSSDDSGSQDVPESQDDSEGSDVKPEGEEEAAPENTDAPQAPESEAVTGDSGEKNASDQPDALPEEMANPDTEKNAADGQ